MAYAPQALELHKMMTWLMCHKLRYYINDGMAYALQAQALHVMRACYMPGQSMGLHVMRSWYISWRPQGLGHIRYVRLRVQYDMKPHKVIQHNTKQCKVIAEAVAYASHTQKLHLMMAWHMPRALQTCI